MLYYETHASRVSYGVHTEYTRPWALLDQAIISGGEQQSAPIPHRQPALQPKDNEANTGQLCKSQLRRENNCNYTELRDALLSWTSAMQSYSDRQICFIVIQGMSS